MLEGNDGVLLMRTRPYNDLGWFCIPDIQFYKGYPQSFACTIAWRLSTFKNKYYYSILLFIAERYMFQRGRKVGNRTGKRLFYGVFARA